MGTPYHLLTVLQGTLHIIVQSGVLAIIRAHLVKKFHNYWWQWQWTPGLTGIKSNHWQQQSNVNSSPPPKKSMRHNQYISVVKLYLLKDIVYQYFFPVWLSGCCADMVERQHPIVHCSHSGSLGLHTEHNVPRSGMQRHGCCIQSPEAVHACIQPHLCYLSK